MKKVFIALLCFMLTFVGLCENFDFSSTTDKELNKLYNSVIEEMMIRNMIAGTPITAGDYIVGKDIKPGKYILQMDGDSSKDDGSFILIVDSEEHCAAKTWEQDSQYVTFRRYPGYGNNPEYVVTLENGNVLRLGSYMTIKPYVPAWWAID